MIRMRPVPHTPVTMWADKTSVVVIMDEKIELIAPACGY